MTETLTLDERAAFVDDPDFLAGIRTLEDAERKQGDIHCALRKASVEAERRRLSVLWHGIEKRVKATMLPARNYGQRLDDLESAWFEVLEMFRPHLSPEIWDQLSPKIAAAFSKARLREGLR